MRLQANWFFNVLQRVRKYKPGDRLLEIGFGLGHFLQVSREVGYEVEGCDVSPFAGQVAELKGFSIHCGEVGDSFYNHRMNYYDVITAFEVIEHVYDPLAFVARIASLLKKGGIFFYSTGNVGAARWYGSRWWYLMPEGHLYYYSPTTLGNILKRCGLELIDPFSAYYYRDRSVIRIMERLRLVNTANITPSSVKERVAFRVLLRSIDILLGSPILCPIARKPL